MWEGVIIHLLLRRDKNCISNEAPLQKKKDVDGRLFFVRTCIQMLCPLPFTTLSKRMTHFFDSKISHTKKKKVFISLLNWVWNPICQLLADKAIIKSLEIWNLKATFSRRFCFRKDPVTQKKLSLSSEMHLALVLQMHRLLAGVYY